MIQLNLTPEQMLKIATYVTLGPSIENAEEKMGRLMGMLYNEYCGYTGLARKVWLTSLMEQGWSDEAMERQLEMILLGV